MLDHGIAGSIFTVIVFVSFIGIVWWAFSAHNKGKFDEAANLPFADDDDVNSNNEKRES